VVIGAFAFILSYLFFRILNYFYPLRVSPIHEELGLNIAEHGAVSVEHDLISILEKQSQSGDLKVRGPQDPFTAGGVIGLYYNKLMSKLEESEAEKNKWRQRISQEVSLAVKVQENFLPKRNLENFPVSGINIPAREVSGDFFSFYPHNESIYFIIADVAGKGIHAGMVMAKASTLFEIMAKDKVDPDEMMFHMNNDLYLTKTGGMFVTSILGVYDLVSDEIFKLEKTKLNNGRFYVFTDGLSESLNEKGEEIGIDGSIEIIENNFNSELKKQLKDITSDVIKKAKEVGLSDDLTLVVIGR